VAVNGPVPLGLGMGWDSLEAGASAPSPMPTAFVAPKPVPVTVTVPPGAWEFGVSVIDPTADADETKTIENIESIRKAVATVFAYVVFFCFFLSMCITYFSFFLSFPKIFVASFEGFAEAWALKLKEKREVMQTSLNVNDILAPEVFSALSSISIFLSIITYIRIASKLLLSLPHRS